MTQQSLEAQFASSIGFVYDRSVDPPVLLGQCCLVSKSRAVTCAASVFPYVDAAWALVINFPYPQISLGVKALALHGEFDRKAAREAYLKQTWAPGEVAICLPNDMATLVLDAELSQIAPEQAGELNRALALPFSATGVEASGNVQGTEFIQLINTIIEQRREGLITLYDNRNMPIARIMIAGGGVQRVYYRGLAAEMAFSELVFRKPALAFSFQSAGTFAWGNMPLVQVPTPSLLAEAQRRAAELPTALSQLGGLGSRYQQVVQQFDPAIATEAIRWVAGPLWEAIDGYIQLDRLSERVGADTYTICLALRELINRGVISQLNRATPFPATGQLGPPVMSHTDQELHSWDPLLAFYLDPLSGKVTTAKGNYFGVANPMQAKNMLHTIALPPNAQGALILKDTRLIGMHGSPQVLKPGQPAPPVKLFQMMWMGALLDMSAKKLRTATDTPDVPTQDAGVLTALRNKLVAPEQAAASATPGPDRLMRLQCPKCFAANAQSGPCFNCGTNIEAPEPEEQPTGILAKHPIGVQIWQLQKQYNLTDKQMIIAASCVVLLPILLLVSCVAGSNKPAPPPVVVEAAHQSSPQAMQLAADLAGFKATPITDWWYEDTSELTKPDVSFGLYSERANQRMIFLPMPDTAPYDHLASFALAPKYCEVNPTTTEHKDDSGERLCAAGPVRYYVMKCKPTPEGAPEGFQSVMTGAFLSPTPGKSVLVYARSLDWTRGTPYDFKSSLGVIDAMMKPVAQAVDPEGTKSKPKDDEDAGDKKPVATEKEMDEYCKTLATSIQSNVAFPDDIQDLIDKKHAKKLKAKLIVGINTDDGTVKKLDFTTQNEKEGFNNALVKAVNASAPFKNLPAIKGDTLQLEVTLNIDKVKVQPVH